MSYSKRIVSSANDLATIAACKRLNLTHVNEYPKCGGTWVSRLLRSYIGISGDYGNSRLVRSNAVIQKHRLFTPHFKKPVIVIRDPRDVWVSYFFYEAYHHKSTGKKVILKSYDENASDEQNLCSYIKEKTQFPERLDPGFSYNKFLENWLDKPHIYLVRYEAMHSRPEETLVGILNYIGIANIDYPKVRAAIQENSFEKITGRDAGTEDKNSHKRKGIVGDWKNIFTAESARLVHDRQQGYLKKLGYEPDGRWVDDITSC
jgi:hypothetical protein